MEQRKQRKELHGLLSSYNGRRMVNCIDELNKHLAQKHRARYALYRPGSVDRRKQRKGRLLDNKNYYLYSAGYAFDHTQKHLKRDPR